MKNLLNPKAILPKQWLKYLSSGTVIIILALTFIFLGYTEFTDWQKKRQVDREIKTLSQQAADLEEKNKQLNDSLSFLNSENFQEKIAREQLNLKKDGELVYDVAPAKDLLGLQNSISKPESNAHKWYSYFFNH